MEEILEERKCKETENSHSINLAGKNLPIIERQLPRNDCLEKIIFILDISKEDDTSSFQFSEGSLYTPLQLAKRAITLFIHNKTAINPQHQYALLVLHEKAEWLVDFTSNSKDIIKELDDLNEVPSTSVCDLTQIFNMLENHINLPPYNEYMSIAPTPYIVRAILMYGRSHCLPEFLEGKKSFETLTKSPYFFLDILYSHEQATDDNKCEKIYDSLCDLDSVGWCYIFEVARNATKYHNYYSRLLAHPLQRPIQKDANYILNENSE